MRKPSFYKACAVNMDINDQITPNFILDPLILGGERVEGRGYFRI